MNKNRRSFNRKKPTLQGRGKLHTISTDGPHNNWLGMPDYYIHTLTVDDKNYKYLTAQATIDVNIGNMVYFRYKETDKERYIDKRSLGIVIDPATLTQ